MDNRIEKHISEEQLSEITEKIINQYKTFLQFTSGSKYSDLFLDEYSPHTRQQSVSWAISSAFPSGRTICGNLKVERLKYGGGHTRPVLYNDVIELHILNQSTDFSAEYLKERYSYNKDGFGNKKLFAFIKFWTKRDKLTCISLCLPNESGIVVFEEVLLDNNQILKNVA